MNVLDYVQTFLLAMLVLMGVGYHVERERPQTFVESAGESALRFCFYLLSWIFLTAVVLAVFVGLALAAIWGWDQFT